MPLGPNFVRVLVGNDGGKSTMHITGKTGNGPAAGRLFDVSWAFAKDVESTQKSFVNGAKKKQIAVLSLQPAKDLHELAQFDSQGHSDWTIPVTTGKLPKVGDWLVVSGRMTPGKANGTPSVFWAQTLQVEQKPV